MRGGNMANKAACILIDYQSESVQQHRRIHVALVRYLSLLRCDTMHHVFGHGSPLHT